MSGGQMDYTWGSARQYWELGKPQIPNLSLDAMKRAADMAKQYQRHYADYFAMNAIENAFNLPAHFFGTGNLLEAQQCKCGEKLTDGGQCRKCGGE